MATIQKRTLKSGEIRYRVEIRIQGHPRRVRTFPKHALAKEWAQKTEAAMRSGEAESESRQEVPDREDEPTFGDLLRIYDQRELSTFPPKSRRQRLTQLRFWKKYLGDKTPVGEIRRGTIAKGLWKLEEGRGPSGQRLTKATCNRYLAALRRMFSFAVEIDWIDRNPAKGGLQAKEPRGRVRFLSEDERDRLFAAVADDPVLELYVLLAVSTGARLGEIEGLRWSAIDFERQQAVLDQTKNGERRVLPLHGRAIATLRAYRDEHESESPFVFPSRNGKPRLPRGRWRKAVERAQLEDFRFHDLRHTAASYLAMNGATLAELAGVLGHKSLQMVKRYAHLAEAHTHEVVRRMNERMIGTGAEP